MRQDNVIAELAAFAVWSFDAVIIIGAEVLNVLCSSNWTELAVHGVGVPVVYFLYQKLFEIEVTQGILKNNLQYLKKDLYHYTLLIQHTDSSKAL